MPRQQILTETQTTSDVFKFRIADPTILLDNFQSGDPWKLQARSPQGEWVDTDLDFKEAGGGKLDVEVELEYRLTGGAVGARAWIFH